MLSWPWSLLRNRLEQAVALRILEPYLTAKGFLPHGLKPGSAKREGLILRGLQSLDSQTQSQPTGLRRLGPLPGGSVEHQRACTGKLQHPDPVAATWVNPA